SPDGQAQGFEARAGARGARAEEARRAPGCRTEEGTRAVEFRTEALLGSPQRIFGRGLPLSADRHEPLCPMGDTIKIAKTVRSTLHGPRPGTPVMPEFAPIQPEVP